MRWQNNLCGIGLALSVLVFSGCASNQAKPANSAENEGAGTTSQGATATSGAATNDAKSAQARQAAPAPVVIPNPSTVSFDKMGTTLDDKGKQVITQLAERAKSARKLTVTGFCDRHQIGNSADAAVARAISVRDELLALGIAPAKIQVKFDTKIAKKHATEIRFD